MEQNLDHFIKFFGEHFGLELPEFPSEDPNNPAPLIGDKYK